MRQAACALVFSLCAAIPAGAKAEARKAPEVASSPERSLLDGYLALLDKKGLAGISADSAQELSAQVQEAQNALLAGKRDEAMVLLLEAVEGPRFQAFESLDEYHTAELILLSQLIEQHALTSAQRIVDRMLGRGSQTTTFAKAFRLAVDIALARGDLRASAARLEKQVEGPLPEDAKSELHYLHGLAAYEEGNLPRAREAFGKLSPQGRFFPSAQYLLGAIAARSQDYREAEARFCKVVTVGKKDGLSFFSDGRFYQVRDMAHLALGRVAHETARADDAFYYYFQVPSDSERVAEALFEAAWASYEGGNQDAAIDGLDQLKARFPHSAHTAEAAVLRGYVYLSRCDFGAAEAEFIAFERKFGAVLAEIERTLDSDARQSTLYRDLTARAESMRRNRASGQELAPDPDGILLALVSADPQFYRLHSEIRVLDAELSRSGHVNAAFRALAQRIASRDAPASRLDERTTSDRARALSDTIAEARSAVDALERDLQLLQNAKGSRDELATLQKARKKLDTQLTQLETRLLHVLEQTPPVALQPAAQELSQRFDEDARYVEALRWSAQRIRLGLEAKAASVGKAALVELRQRIAQELRRARIGRIDAVMGSKRQVELQIESLAAGNFPPELVDPLRIQSLLRDDEEYWPFEGEDWPDEFVERYAPYTKERR